MKILVLAGGHDQIILIKELKKRNHIVLLADYLERPLAARYADRHFQVSTLDIEAIYELSKNENIELITTACTDQALLTVAIVSERLGLPCYISSEVARNVTDKTYMKKKFVEGKIPTAKFCVLDGGRGIEEIVFSEIRFPAIVKPCDCNSSKGVIRVNNEKEIKEGISCALNLSRTKKVIVEEFIDGIEISIDVWRDEEGVKIIGLSQSNKIKQTEDKFTICQSIYCHNISKDIVDKIQIIAEKVYETFNLGNCPLLMQVLLNRDEISVIEISARMGGGSKYKMIEYMTGINIMGMYVDAVLSGKVKCVYPKWSTKCIEIDFVYAHDGIINKVLGVDELLKCGKVKEVFWYKNIGDRISGRSTSSDRVLGLLLVEDDERSIMASRKEIIESIDIMNDVGKSIIFKECLKNERF